MGEYVTAKVPNLPPLKVGDIFTQAGACAILRVIGPDNLMQRFTGTRRERLAVLADWRKQKAVLEQRKRSLDA